MDAKKSRTLYIKRYLEKHTDEEHQATVSDMIAFLNTEGIEADRKTVARDIERLMAEGFDVVVTRGTQNRYFLGSRIFELPELKLLIDAVQASRFISRKKSESLIGKLTGFASRHQAGELERHLYVDKQVKSDNEQTYITIDLLNTAISQEKRARFKYYEYTPEKKKIYKHDGQIYEFSPYGLIWNGGQYYTVGYSSNHGRVITFRVDRIAKPALIKKPAVSKPEGFDMAFYARSVFQMYDGPARRVTLLCPNRHIKTVVDTFGEDTQTAIAGKDRFTAIVDVAVSPTFLGWALSNSMDILAPEDAVEAFASFKNGTS